jgi:hypothetical protein
MKHSITHAVSLALMMAEGKQTGSGGVQSSLSPERIVGQQGKAEAKNAKAEKSYEAEGKSIAKDYLKSLGDAAATWQAHIVSLLKTANSAQCERAMKGATEVAEAEADETAAASLKKRISEARRLFKAAFAPKELVKDGKKVPNDKSLGHAAAVKMMEAKGSWHQKIAKLPKGNAGRPAGTTGGTQDQTAAAAPSKGEPAKGGVVGVEDKAGKIHAVPVGQVIDAVKRLSYADLLKVIDVCAYQLRGAPEKTHLLMRSLGEQIIKLRDKQDAAQVESESRSEAVSA